MNLLSRFLASKSSSSSVSKTSADAQHAPVEINARPETTEPKNNSGMLNTNTRLETSRDVQTRPELSDSSRENWLTVEEAVSKFNEAGVPRAIRTIQKYCLNGKLDCHQAITEIGVRYYVDPASIDTYVSSVAQMAPIKGDTPDGEGEWSNAKNEAPEVAHDERTVAHSATAPISLDERLVGTLEREIDFLRSQIGAKDKQLELKDSQIAALIERDRETNVLIQGLQRLILPMSGQPQQGSEPADR